MPEEIDDVDARASSSVWPTGKRCAVSLSFDDGLDSQLELAVPLLDRYRTRATFYLSTHMRENLTPDSRAKLIDPWAAALAEGHEVGNHTRTHPCSVNFPWTAVYRCATLEQMSLGDMAQQVEEAQRLLEKELGRAPRTFAYPCGMTYVGKGVHCHSYVPLVAERFVVGRTFNDECLAAPLRCDLARVPGLRMDDQEIEPLRDLVERARATGYWLVLVGHAVTRDKQHYATRVDVLDRLLSHLTVETDDVWVDTVEAVGQWVLRVQTEKTPAPKR